MNLPINSAPTDRRSQIVADGPERFRDAGDYRAVRQRVLAEARQRHAAEMERAPFWRRLWLGAKILQEARAELSRRFPRGSLHVARADR